MGDSGEGLIDADARIQERMEELERERTRLNKGKIVRDPEKVHALESLRLAAYGDDTVGTVTAVSDNAGAFSVPELEQYCPIPERWDLPATQRAVLQQAGLRGGR